MKSTSDCDELRELIPAYSIGATDPDEMQMVEAGLRNCPELAAELAAYHRMIDRLGETVPQTAPPPALLDSLLTAAQQRRKSHNRLAWWPAAAACLLLALLSSNLYWISRLTTIEDQIAALDAAQTLVLPAAANGEQTGARGRVVWIPGTREALLEVNNFPPLRQNEVFQAWLRRGQQVMSIGTFRTSDAGSGSLVFDAGLLNETFDGLGITREPGSGSPAPTSPPVVRWQRASG